MSKHDPFYTIKLLHKMGHYLLDSVREEFSVQLARASAQRGEKWTRIVLILPTFGLF